MCTLFRKIRIQSLEFNWSYLNQTCRGCSSNSGYPYTSNKAYNGRQKNSRNSQPRGAFLQKPVRVIDKGSAEDPNIRCGNPSYPITSNKASGRRLKSLRNAQPGQSLLQKPIETIDEDTCENPAASPKYANKFSMLGLKTDLVRLLELNDISEPTLVQSEAIPLLLKRRSVVIASQTGSGKTLAFLLPVIQNMSRYSCSHLIIVPSRELASQIYKEALRYGVPKGSVSRLVSGVNEQNEKSLKAALKSSILIATPERLFDVVEENPDVFNHVRSITMDEVDKLLISNKSSIESMKRRRKRTKPVALWKIRPSEKLFTMLVRRWTQVVALSATVTKEVIDKLCDIGFNPQSAFIDLVSKGEAIPGNIRHHHFFVNGSTSLTKICNIGQMLRISNQKSTLVFLQQNESVDQAVKDFSELGFNAVALYQQLKLPPSSPEAATFMKKFESGEVQIVVANEDVVRGMDFPFLDNMYVTFVPSHYSTYVHLAGRVGRKGQPGRVITLLSDGDDQHEYETHMKNMDLLGVKSTRLEIR